MDSKNIDLLKKAGLTEGEAKTYLALITLGTSSVGNIIKKSEISASKVYDILNRLIKKGLAGMIVEEGIKIFSAAEPEQLINYLNDEGKKIEKNKKEIKKIIPFLKSKKETAETKPIVEFTKGKKGFKTLYDEMIEAGKSGDTLEALAIRNKNTKLPKKWYQISEKLYEKNIKQHTTYEYYSWIEGDPKITKRKLRKEYYPIVLPKKYKNLPTINSIGDYTIFYSLDENGELFTILIRNKNFTKAIRKLMSIVRSTGTVPDGFEIDPEENLNNTKQ